MAWTDEMIEGLTTMWAQGLTTAEIAKQLGVSKNSIVGKVHRLSLPARPSPIKKKDDETDEATEENATTEENIVDPIVENVAEPVTTEKNEKSQKIAEPVIEQAPIAEKVVVPTLEVSQKKEERLPLKPRKVKGLILTELDNHTCRWPMGDPRDESFCFCGKKVRAGQTYCEEHSAVAYVKPIKKS